MIGASWRMIALLPAPDQQRFGWVGWLAAAAPAGVVCLVGAIVALGWLFRPEEEARVSRAALRRQHRVLGPLSRSEWIALAGLAVLVAGLVVQPFLGIEPAWFALVSLVLVTATILGREQFRASLDWGFLVFFGILLGSSTVLQRAGYQGAMSMEHEDPLYGSPNRPGPDFTPDYAMGFKMAHRYLRQYVPE